MNTYIAALPRELRDELNRYLYIRNTELIKEIFAKFLFAKEQLNYYNKFLDLFNKYKLNCKFIFKPNTRDYDCSEFGDQDKEEDDNIEEFKDLIIDKHDIFSDEFVESFCDLIIVYNKLIIQANGDRGHHLHIDGFLHASYEQFGNINQILQKYRYSKRYVLYGNYDDFVMENVS